MGQSSSDTLLRGNRKCHIRWKKSRFWLKRGRGRSVRKLGSYTEAVGKGQSIREKETIHWGTPPERIVLYTAAQREGGGKKGLHETAKTSEQCVVGVEGVTQALRGGGRRESLPTPQMRERNSRG